MSSNIKKYEKIIMLIFFTVLVFSLLLATGTITSGLHLVDDHEYLEYELIRVRQGGSLLSCIKYALADDGGIRFRPMYNILRVLLYGACGTNMVLWSVEKGVEIVLALFFFYLIARKLNCKPVFALLFALVVMVGPQSVIWWKLGPQEGTGAMLLGIGFYLLIKWLETEKKRYVIGSYLVLSVMALYKESLLLLLPFIIFYFVYHYCLRDGYSWEVIKGAIKKNLLWIVLFSITFLVILGTILYTIGIASLGYVGVDVTITPNEYKHIWINVMQNWINYFIYLAVPATILMLTYFKHWKLLLGEVVMGCMIMIPQMILYISPGLEERYIVPWSFGFAYLFILAVNRVNNFGGIRKAIYIGMVVVYLIPNFQTLIKEAEYFTYRGHSVESILKAALEQSTEDTKILSAYSPYVESDITVTCWMLLRGRDNVYIWSEEDKTCTDKAGEGAGNKADVSEMDIILFYNPEDRHYCYEPDIDLTGYERINYGTLTMCIRHESGE